MPFGWTTCFIIMEFVFTFNYLLRRASDHNKQKIIKFSLILTFFLLFVARICSMVFFFFFFWSVAHSLFDDNFKVCSNNCEAGTENMLTFCAKNEMEWDTTNIARFVCRINFKVNALRWTLLCNKNPNLIAKFLATIPLEPREWFVSMLFDLCNSLRYVNHQTAFYVDCNIINHHPSPSTAVTFHTS